MNRHLDMQPGISSKLLYPGLSMRYRPEQQKAITNDDKYVFRDMTSFDSFSEANAQSEQNIAPDDPGLVRNPPAAQAIRESELQDWIVRIMRQDEAALSALYEATVGRVYGLALRITRNAELAEEVTEDTFWQVWRQAPRFDPVRGSALSWMMTMARSRALDALRARDPAIATEDTTALLDAQGKTDGSPEDLLDAVQSEHRLHTALEQLDAQPRQLIALAFFRGLTHDEISAHTGIPLGTVKSHIRRGLLSLRALLDDPAAGLSSFGKASDSEAS